MRKLLVATSALLFAQVAAAQNSELSLDLKDLTAPAESSASAPADPGWTIGEINPVLNLDIVSQRQPSYLLPAVDVPGVKPELKEEQRVGSYNQPRWTATRRFPNARVYVIPEGHIEIEYWIRPTFGRDGVTKIRQLYEIEIGLPYRLQLDLYFRTDQQTDSNKALMGGQFELRWALADWDVIPGNPTFYIEYLQLEDRPNRIEPKLLFGGELAPRWHWAANFVWEQEIGRASRGEGEHELEITNGISYTVIDSVFSVGLESVINFNNVRENRSAWNTEIYLGPSFQWKPIPPLTINFVPMAGLTNASGVCRLYLNVGWEF